MADGPAWPVDIVLAGVPGVDSEEGDGLAFFRGRSPVSSDVVPPRDLNDCWVAQEFRMRDAERGVSLVSEAEVGARL